MVTTVVALAVPKQHSVCANQTWRERDPTPHIPPRPWADGDRVMARKKRQRSDYREGDPIICVALSKIVCLLRQQRNRLRYPDVVVLINGALAGKHSPVLRLMKVDRDANFIERTAGVSTVGFLPASNCASNETGMLTKICLLLGMLAVDNQASIRPPWRLVPNIGRGAMTNHCGYRANVVMVMGRLLKRILSVSAGDGENK